MSRSSAAPVRVAVVGAGTMGENHLRVYSTMKGADLVAVVEPDDARRKDAADRYGCKALNHVEDLVGKVDAVSLAAPSVHHGELGVFLLENGVHCLIEKPLATSETECQRLIDAAARSGTILLVGHIERFNPAVQQLSAMLGDGKHAIHAIDARRLSSTQRITDIDVVEDLMIHDLDIVLSLMGTRETSVTARGVHVDGASGQDYVTALLGFPGGALASLTASRITQNKVRELHVTSDLGYITLDYGTQELLIYRGGNTAKMRTPQAEPGSYILDLVIERALVNKREPLAAELRHFLDAVTKGVTPLVDGPQALEALRLAWRIQDEFSRTAA